MDFDNFPYTVIKGDRRSNDVVELDGKWFTECRYVGCELIFRGERPFVHMHSDFLDAKWLFEDRARMVLSQLARMFPDEELLKIMHQLRDETHDLH